LFFGNNVPGKGSGGIVPNEDNRRVFPHELNSNLTCLKEIPDSFQSVITIL
jgi:hypothetical protein